MEQIADPLGREAGVTHMARWGWDGHARAAGWSGEARTGGGVEAERARTWRGRVVDGIALGRMRG